MNQTLALVRSRISWRWKFVVCRLFGCRPAGPYRTWRRAALIGPGAGLGPFMIESSNPDAQVIVRARVCARCDRRVTVSR